MFEWNANEKRLEALHHPFTAPFPDDIGDLKAAQAMLHDLVYNAFEGWWQPTDLSELQAQVFGNHWPDAGRGPQAVLIFFWRRLSMAHCLIAGLSRPDRLVKAASWGGVIRDAIAFPKHNRLLPAYGCLSMTTGRTSCRH